MNASDRSTEALEIPQGAFRESMRRKVRQMLEEELATALGAGRHERGASRWG